MAMPRPRSPRRVICLSPMRAQDDGERMLRRSEPSRIWPIPQTSDDNGERIGPGLGGRAVTAGPVLAVLLLRVLAGAGHALVAGLAAVLGRLAVLRRLLP